MVAELDPKWFGYLTPLEASIIRERDVMVDALRTYQIEINRIKMRCRKRAERRSITVQHRFAIPILENAR